MIKLFRKLLGSVREYKKVSIITPIFIIFEALVESIIPFIVAKLINTIEEGCDMNELIKNGVILIVLALFSLTMGGLAGVTSAKASSGFAKNLRHDIFERIQMFSFENIDKFSTSSLVTRLTTDIRYVQMSYMMLIRIVVRCPLMMIFSIVMSWIMGGPLALMFVVVVPFLLFSLILIAKKALPAFKRVFKKYDKLNESVEENVVGIRTVKGFVREEYEINKLKDASENIRKDFTRAERIVALNRPAMQLSLYFNMIFVLYIGSSLVIKSSGLSLGVGQLSTMITYGFQTLMSLMIISMIYVMLTMSYESCNRIVEVLSEKPTIVSPEKPVMEVKDGSVDFDNVSFKYSAEAHNYALKDINLHIDSGMTVGILGMTGSGKTSVVQLISRLYDVSEGSVKVGGIDVREYDVTTLRTQISQVLQKNMLFSGSIKDNLRWGNENATDEEIVEACKLAQADEFVRAHKDGYDYMIEQEGTNVSGGQKQRLCIARALLQKPKILILDDSTSAVDTKTDALIRSGLKNIIPDTTKIIIAQRVASVMEADMIVMLERGQVMAVGTHDELMESCPEYRETYYQQTKGVDEK